MSLHGMPSAGGGAWSGMKSLRRDTSVKNHQIAKGTIKRILTFSRPYRASLVVFLIAVVVDSIIVSINPLILRAIIDKGIIGHKQGLVIALAITVALIAVADAGLSIIQRWVSAVIGERLIYDMRARVFAHIQEMPIAFFSRTQTGALISRLNNDIIGAQQAFTDLLSNVVGNIILVAITLAAMFVLSWPITLGALVLLPIFLIPARRMGQKLGTLMREGFGLNAEMNQMMTERFNVSGAMLAKLYGDARSESTRFNAKAGRVRDIGITQAAYQRIFFVCLTLTASLATAFVYGFGGVAALHGELMIGTLVALTAYLARLYSPLTALSSLQVDVMTTVVSFERVFEVLDLTPMIGDAENAVAIPDGPATVIFDRVSFTYPSAEQVSLASLESVTTLDRTVNAIALDDVSFRVAPGTMTAIVGPSGAGKTTLSMLLPRLYDVTGGAITINGLDVRDASTESVRAAIGVVTQDAHLFHETLAANLRFAREDATDEELFHALRQAQLGDLLAGLPEGLNTVVGERGYRLSGGEKQRVAIARLLLKAPRIVILDEATAHLDSESEVAVQRALDETFAGRTALVIAHRLSTIRGADQILVMNAGRIVERGTHAELLSMGGLYGELYETQFSHGDKLID